MRLVLPGIPAIRDGLIGLLTLSPHSEAAIDLVRRVSATGVHVAIGHTEATPEQIHAAAAAGATLSTHLGNGISALLARHPNPIWAQLADDRLTATFIGRTPDAQPMRVVMKLVEGDNVSFSMPAHRTALYRFSRTDDVVSVDGGFNRWKDEGRDWASDGAY